MSRSNFEKCAEINALVGNTVKHSLETAKHQAKIIQLEVDEMHESIDTENLERLRDDVGDMLFTAYGLGARMGFPVDDDFEEICKSQYTKFDLNEEDAGRTKQKYDALGIPTYWNAVQASDGTTYFVTYVAETTVTQDGKQYPAGKWLKSFRFEEPVFKPLTATQVMAQQHREEALLRRLLNYDLLKDPAFTTHQVFMFGLLEDFSDAIFMGSTEHPETIFDVLPQKAPSEDPVLDRCIRFVIIDRQGTVLVSIHRKLRSLLGD